MTGAVIEGFDRVRIAVPDLAAAREDYELLLGMAAVPVADELCFGLRNTVLTLQQAPLPRARVEGLVLVRHGAGPATCPVANDRGLSLSVCDGAKLNQLRNRGSAPAIDHVVLRTSDAAACIRLFGDQLGLRLALDQTVPEWGGRMLFFRAGKLTLEVLELDEDSDRDDYFWGISYQVEDLESETCRLRAAGVEVSPSRDGRKPGTRVASVKSHCQGIPTLLLQPAPPAT